MNNIQLRLTEEIRLLHENSSPSDFNKNLNELLSKYDFKINETVTSEESDILQYMEYFLAEKKYEGVAEGTYENYKHTITKFANDHKSIKIKDITIHNLRSWIASMENYKVSSKNGYISRIKTFFAWLKYEDYIHKDVSLKLKLLEQPKRLKRGLDVIELERMRCACETDRERALVEVLFATGCRISEIENMNFSDLDSVNNTIKVIGKGDKERIVCFTDKSFFYLKKYIDARETFDDLDALFVSERFPYQRLKRRSLGLIIKGIAERTNIEISVSPHRFRHTMATLGIQSGVDLVTIQHLLGHSSPDMTLIYAQQSMDNIKHEYKQKMTH